jgi:hypothetical protein
MNSSCGGIVSGVAVDDMADAAEELVELGITDQVDQRRVAVRRDRCASTTCIQLICANSSSFSR